MKKVVTAILGIVLAAALFIYCQNHWLYVSNYTLNSPALPDKFNGFKILQLSDLHSHSFGENNTRLLKKIQAINPDIIVVTGDMLNSLHDDGHVFRKLAQELANYYPLYYISGNHEQIARLRAEQSGAQWNQDYLNSLSQSGVTLLDNQMISLKRDNQHINLYGLKVPLMYYSAKNTTIPEEKIELNVSLIEKYLGKPDQNAFNILLVHTPSYLSTYDQWGADLIFAGHMHGGIVRIPFKGGLLSPEKEFFPYYDAGRFEAEKGTMFVSRGLGNYSLNLRIFNPPELVVVTLTT
ncbi:metallophosphoesterase [Syntrophomonas erecta]